MTRPPLPALALALSLLAGGAALAQDEPVWTLNSSSNAASLAYAIPESDDAGPMLWCDRSVDASDHMVTVTFFIERRLAVRLRGENWVDAAGKPSPWPARLTLTSGAVTAEFAAKADPDEMNGGSQITAKVPVGAPVLAEFARTGRLVFASFGERRSPPVVVPAKVAGLLRVCR